MKAFVVLAVLSVLSLTACSDSDNPGTPASSDSANPGSTPGSTPTSNPVSNPTSNPVTNPTSNPPTDPASTPTNGQDGLPLILQSQLETFFEVANGAALQEMTAILLHIVSPIEAGFTLKSSRTDESDLTNRDLYTCTKGGTVEVWRSAVADEQRSNADAKDCGFGPRVVSGLFYLTDPINESAENYLLVSDVKDYSVTSDVDESTTTLKSGNVRFSSNNQTGTPRVAVSWSGDTLDVSRLAGSYSVNSPEYLTRVSDRDAPLPDNLLGRTTKMNALVVGNELRQVRTPQAFLRSANPGNFTSGIMTVTSDKSTVEINADSGSESTFLLTETRGDVTTTYGVQWSDRFQFKVLDPLNTDLNLGAGAVP